MSIPLDLLEDNKTNTYEVTCVAIQNAEKITRNGEDELAERGEKVVSESLNQVLHNSVEYVQEDA